MWDLESGEVLKRFENKNTQVHAVAISPDGCHAIAVLSADHLVTLMRLPAPPAGAEAIPKAIKNKAKDPAN